MGEGKERGNGRVCSTPLASASLLDPSVCETDDDDDDDDTTLRYDMTEHMLVPSYITANVQILKRYFYIASDGELTKRLQ